MNASKPAPPLTTLLREPGVKYYLGLSAGSLGLVFLVLEYRGVPLLFAVLPLIVGLGGAAGRLSRAPLIYLMTLGAVISIDPVRFFMSPRGGNVWLSDVLICAGVLGYMAGQYRLQSLLTGVFPTSSASGEKAAKEVHRGPATVPLRAARSVTPREVGTLLLLLPAWAVIAQFLSAALPPAVGGNWGGLHGASWRAMTLLWILAIGGVIVAGVFDYYHRRHMTGTEATLYLQDVLWQETRREQRRHDRWRFWARLGYRLDIVDRLIDITVVLWLVALTIGLVLVVLWLFESFSS